MRAVAESAPSVFRSEIALLWIVWQFSQAWESCERLVVPHVEGGGFFSSSASGYSKGLTLLLLGRRSEERPMRVSPWNQFQLLEQKDPDIQLASRKNRRFRGCAYFICFGRASVGLDGSSPPKVGSAHQSDGSQGTSSVSASGEFSITDGGNRKNGRNVRLKSSLKKPLDGVNDVRCVLSEKENDDPSSCTERRQVQWTDACGGELVDVREFEPSETGESDDEFEDEGGRSCSCWIQ